MHQFNFEPVRLPPAAVAVRREVRGFIAGEVASGAFTPSKNSWSSFDAAFSKKCGERGFIGRHDESELDGATAAQKGISNHFRDGGGDSYLVLVCETDQRGNLPGALPGCDDIGLMGERDREQRSGTRSG